MPSSSFNVGFPARSNVPECIVLAGTIITDTTTPTVKRGKGFTVSKPGAGVYRVTWNRSYPELIGDGAVLRKPAGEAVFLAGAVYDPANNYADFRVENSSGAATDAAATDEISFLLVLQASGLPR